MWKKILFLYLLSLVVTTTWSQKPSAKIWERRNCKLLADSIVAAIERGDSVRVSFCEISGVLFIGEDEYPEGIDTVNSYIAVEYSRFLDGVYFYWCHFQERVIFFDVEFMDNVAFFNSIFDKYAGFNKSTFGRFTDFDDAIFREKAVFKEATFTSSTEFNGLTFREEADFSRLTFRGYVQFMNCHFMKNADFSHSRFAGKARFSNDWFDGEADFSSNTFSREASFPSDFSGLASFSKSMFNGRASFVKAIFHSDVDFLGTAFVGELDFEDATFHGWMELTSEQVENMYASWKQLRGHLAYESSTLYRLIARFEELRQLEDADALYLFMKDRERRHKHPFFRLYEFWLIQQTCGYGVRPRRVLATSGLVMLLFAVFYYSIQIREPKRALGAGLKRIGTKAYNALYFSINTFVSGAPIEWTPEDTESSTKHYLFRILTTFERTLGWILLVLFVVTLTRKFIR